MQNAFRNKVIVDIVKEKKNEDLVLVLVDKIKHGEILLNLFIEEGLKVLFIQGKTKNKKQVVEDILQDKYQVIIATKIFNEGIDIPKLKTLIIASGGKSSVKTIQSTGRVLRIFDGKGFVIPAFFTWYVKNAPVGP